MIKKVVFVSLLNSYGKDVAYRVATSLDLFYLDIDENIEYEFLKIPNIYKSENADYFHAKVNKIISNALTFEDTIFFVEYETLKNNLKLFEKCCILFIDIPFQQLEKNQDENFVLNKLVYEDRKKVLSSFATFIDYENFEKEKCVKKICNMIKEEKWFYIKKQ